MCMGLVTDHMVYILHYATILAYTVQKILYSPFPVELWERVLLNSALLNLGFEHFG